MTSKVGLTEQKRGKGGSLVRLVNDHMKGDGTVVTAGTVLVVKDTMERKGYNRPERIGVGIVPNNGLAFGVAIADVELI